MKARYPMEAFALAMVIFSQNMRDALITGILILLITTLGLVLDGSVGIRLPKWSRISCTIILMVSLTYSLFQIVLKAILGYDIDSTTSIFHVFLGLLIANHVIYGDEDRNYNLLLLEGAGAFATLLIISIIREFMTEGSVYGFKLAEFKYTSNGFSQVVAGFILTGLGLAVLNKIFKYKDVKSEGIYVILPVALLVQPFTIEGIESSVSMVIAILAVMIMVYSISKHLVFSKLSKEVKNLPAELVSAGMVYMILSMF
ncbi:MAG TPA: hypothetical protein PK304_02225 [Mobilitalea sp.]|nr:hypothetical protein [Mobilitalea sp.]